jgi:hypothetical protein
MLSIAGHFVTCLCNSLSSRSVTAKGTRILASKCCHNHRHSQLIPKHLALAIPVTGIRSTSERTTAVQLLQAHNSTYRVLPPWPSRRIVYCQWHSQNLNPNAMTTSCTRLLLQIDLISMFYAPDESNIIPQCRCTLLYTTSFSMK